MHPFATAGPVYRPALAAQIVGSDERRACLHHRRKRRVGAQSSHRGRARRWEASRAHGEPCLSGAKLTRALPRAYSARWCTLRGVRQGLLIRIPWRPQLKSTLITPCISCQALPLRQIGAHWATSSTRLPRRQVKCFGKPCASACAGRKGNWSWSLHPRALAKPRRCCRPTRSCASKALPACG